MESYPLTILFSSLKNTLNGKKMHILLVKKTTLFFKYGDNHFSFIL